MPNINEWERLDQERLYWRAKATNLGLGKSSREAALAEMRKCERALGLPLEDVVHKGGSK